MPWAELDLPLKPPFPPMEAKLVHALPAGDGWLFEPKWDGFRCIAFKNGATVELQSKAGQPLGRYFPEVVAAVAALDVPRIVLDGEMVIPANGGFEFEPLLQRIHPAASRIARLAKETPASLVAFDLLVDAGGRVLLDDPLARRKASLEALSAVLDAARIGRTPATRDPGEAQRWLEGAVKGIDGVVAKRLDGRYEPGERAMRKVKLLRTADCVVAGLRWATGKQRGVGSLLLGLFDDAGLLQYVGHAAAFDAARRLELAEQLAPLVCAPGDAGPCGFTGDAPGGPSRWARERETEWIPLRPEKVVEVEYHHASGGRFRHGTRLVRFRPDKDPRSCTMEQMR